MTDMRAFTESDWRDACVAGKVGLKNATLLNAVMNLFYSPLLPGGTVEKVLVGLRNPKTGAWRSARLGADGPLLTTPSPDMKNMRDVFDIACTKYADQPCMGKRAIEKMRVEANVDKYQLGPYTWITYRDAHTVARAFGRGLRSLCGAQTGDLINFFADTCQEWHLAMQGCFGEALVVSTTYANLGEEAVEFAIQQAEVNIVFTDAALAASVVARVVSRCPKVRHVVYIRDRRPVTHKTHVSDEDIRAALPKNVSAHSFEQVVEAGVAAPVVDLPELESTTQCVVMYTSGSTAKPKGVIISHGNMLAVVAGTTSVMPDMGPGDRFIGYLPLAHILEMIAEIGSLASGSCIGYGSPKTLSDAGVCIDPETCRGDAPELRPTLFAAVPMIFDKMRSAVLAKVKSTGGVAAKVFEFALEHKIKALDKGYAAPLWDKIVFDKLRTRLLGGKVRYMLSGGGPLSRATQQFMNVLMNAPVGQGFGLTETVGAASTTWPNDRSYGKVGVPIGCNEIRLEDWEEGGYFVDPAKNGECTNPRGEIIVGGHNVTMGYFKMPEETANSYFTTEDGLRWFRTGDIGEMFPNGTLKIIDRKKDLVKLSGGEYVSYGKLEPLLRDSEYVDNAFIYAHSEASYCVAVVTIRPHIKEIPSAEVVLKDVARIFKSQGVLHFETPKKLHIAVDTAWTPESDLVTAALKLKRQNLVKHYKSVLDGMYAN